MQLINKVGLIALLSASVLACKKSDNNSTPNNNNGGGNTSDTTGQYGTPYANVPDPKNVVMYEVNILAFSNTHDLAGVTARLDSIKALGVNVVWLMPVYPLGTDSKSIGSPYCIKDYMSVNTAFGTLADLRTLVATAHNDGMAVVLDWVADHTSWDNAWIANKAWYHQDASGNIISPSSGSTTYTDVAWLNYASTDMRQAMITAMKYWIKAANIDGYRCDFASNVPSDFWTQAIDTLNLQGHKLILLAENSAATDFTSGFQLDYAWNFYTALKNTIGGSQSATTIGSTNTSENNSVPPGDYKLRFVTNHDEEQSDGTPVTIYNGKAGALAAFVLSAYVGGQPLIYNGDEVGNSTILTMYNTSTQINWTANHDVTAAYEKLIAFRSSSDAVKSGTTTYYNDANVAAFERVSGTDTVLVLVNTRNATSSYTASSAFANTSWHDQMNSGATVTLGSTISLSAYQYMILSK